MLKKTSQKGFTIVELLIVIVVIGILAALVLNTFAGVQKRARDSQRTTSVNSLATQLEAYYSNKGSYPALATSSTDGFANTAWVSNNLKGFDAKALFGPGQSTNSYTAGATNAPSATYPNNYLYTTTPASCGSPTTSANPPVDQTPNPAPCTAFTITWFSEDKNATQTKSSLNQ